jgi:hypothetical protein
MSKPEERMLTTSEAAEILGVKPSSVRVWLSEEGPPRFPNARKFGRDWQIPASDLEGIPKGRKRGRPKKSTEKADSLQPINVSGEPVSETILKERR